MHRHQRPSVSYPPGLFPLSPLSTFVCPSFPLSGVSQFLSTDGHPKGPQMTLNRPAPQSPIYPQEPPTQWRPGTPRLFEPILVRPLWLRSAPHLLPSGPSAGGPAPLPPSRPRICPPVSRPLPHTDMHTHAQLTFTHAHTQHTHTLTFTRTVSYTPTYARARVVKGRASGGRDLGRDLPIEEPRGRGRPAAPAGPRRAGRQPEVEGAGTRAQWAQDTDMKIGHSLLHCTRSLNCN